jgi:hypothetical protein
MWPVLASNQLKHTWVDCWTIMVDVGVPRPFHNHSLIAELDHLVLLNMREKNPALYLNQIWNTASLLEALVCCPPLAIALEDYPSIKKGLWGREKRKKRVMTGRLSLHKKRFVRERKEKEESYVVYLRPWGIK